MQTWSMAMAFPLISILALACSVDAPVTSGTQASPEVEALLQEMIVVCEQHVAESEQRFTSGVGSRGELNEARTTLLEARIKLAEIQSGVARPDETSAANDAIVALLEEAVVIRERDYDFVEKAFASGQLGSFDKALANAKLSETRIELARARGDGQAVIAELETLVELWERLVKLGEDYRSAGSSDGRFSDAQIAALETQIDLIAARERYE